MSEVHVPKIHEDLLRPREVPPQGRKLQWNHEDELQENKIVKTWSKSIQVEE